MKGHTTKQYNEFNNILGEEYDLLKLVYPHYDRIQESVGDVFSEHFKSNANPHIKTLEVGSGTGITTKVLLGCSPKIRIIAVDNEEKMMEQLETNLHEWHATDQVVLVKKDIESYLKEVSDNTFNCVVSGNVIHNMDQSEKERIVSEIYRVLKPGGIFINADKYANSDPEVREKVFQEQISRYNVYDTIGRSDYKKEWLEHMHNDERPERIFIEGVAKSYMIKIGFKKVTTHYREMMEAVVSGIK